jgi:hypothetical protein
LQCQAPPQKPLKRVVPSHIKKNCLKTRSYILKFCAHNNSKGYKTLVSQPKIPHNCFGLSAHNEVTPVALHPLSDSDDLPQKPKQGRPKKKIRATENVNVRMTETEKAELQKRTQSLYTSDSHLVKAAAIHSNLHTLRRLLYTKEAMPDELKLRLEVKDDPGKPHHLKVMLFHYPKFNGYIERFDFYTQRRRLQLIFGQNQIYEFTDDIDESIASHLINSNKILVVLMDQHMLLHQDEMYFAPLVLYKTPSILYTVPDYMTRLPSENWEKF